MTKKGWYIINFVYTKTQFDGIVVLKTGIYPQLSVAKLFCQPCTIEYVKCRIDDFNFSLRSLGAIVMLEFSFPKRKVYSSNF